ncbi:TadE/TadG family type IV pilus assembly protein [Pseudodesulfovibrio sp. zrk46]|uniref:TadE/TadG family type IV pilus assembly protein n=1 Tax=Pseudodesulfovibrio sp. zrk46 TaxID=2725288 RepID=UPI001448B98C|nr:TadE/TadG family type IV pilus assembly protein [Pseudodesulfovibrio sp. zrk46]QJB55003.1 pilus assembly protein [Pseudodesulfovibrio sp. zrk46]
MTSNRRNNKTRRGIAAVEVGLLLPVFMMLLMGIMDFGRMYWTQSVVRGAAYEGVRVAILSETTNAQVESTVLEELNIGGITDTASVSVGAREPSTPVDVTVSVPFTFIAVDNLIPTLSGVSTISATAVMTHER